MTDSGKGFLISVKTIKWMGDGESTALDVMF